MVDADINKLDKSSNAGEVQGAQAVPITYELPSISTVASLIAESKTPPPSIESRGGDMAVAVIQVESSSAQANDLPNMVKDMESKLEQVSQFPADKVMEAGKEEFQTIFAAISDMDGDGIPDDYDKYPGETVANVAARINKIGKYAVTDDNKMKVFSSVKGITKSLESLLNKISAMSAAASSSVKPATDALEMDGLGGDEKTSSIEKSRQR
ncbi:MAG: hypothetical protein LBJ75_01570 [Puniceicoccales bacterium]|jgi:uncharacterized protein YlxW (UPF0749 family)|nr:hypothetical protein [Puniceicoccales bacterium]